LGITGIFQIPPRLRLLAVDNLLRRVLEDDFAAVGAAALSHLDDVIRLGDEFKAVFDDDDRVFVGNKFSEQGKKFFASFLGVFKK